MIEIFEEPEFIIPITLKSANALGTLFSELKNMERNTKPHYSSKKKGIIYIKKKPKEIVKPDFDYLYLESRLEQQVIKGAKDFYFDEEDADLLLKCCFFIYKYSHETNYYKNKLRNQTLGIIGPFIDEIISIKIREKLERKDLLQ